MTELTEDSQGRERRTFRIGAVFIPSIGEDNREGEIDRRRAIRSFLVADGCRCTNGRDGECGDFGRRISALTAITTTLAVVVPLTDRVRVPMIP